MCAAPNRKPFDAVAGHYDLFMRLSGLFHDDAIRRLLAAGAGERLVDLAGGTGHHAALLADLYREVTVVDESARMLAQVPRRENIHTVQADARQTGLPDASFDDALLSDALHHIEDHEELLREIDRLLRPGGRLLVHDFDPSALRVRVQGFLERLFFRRPMHFRTPAALQALCERQGFHLLAVEKHRGFYLLLVGKQHEVR